MGCGGLKSTGSETNGGLVKAASVRHVNKPKASRKEASNKHKTGFKSILEIVDCSLIFLDIRHNHPNKEESCDNNGFSLVDEELTLQVKSKPR